MGRDFKEQKPSPVKTFETQRGFFGAHTSERPDKPGDKPLHSEWSDVDEDDAQAKSGYSLPNKKSRTRQGPAFSHWLIPQTTGVTPGLGMGVGVKEESHFRVSSGARSSLLLRTCSQVTRLPV